ncbi:hypothetical protein [Streptomyces sirii]|uniref:hypothetical protein n=1 Tax=Streptomyces sirii TaxID=3127701 RepID=UPI003D3609B4
MLRVHFTGQDLTRTRVADGADPLWETVLSLHALRESRTEPALAAWRQHAVRHGPGPLRTLLPLVPKHGYFPDFLTPFAALDGVEPGLEAVMSTSRRRLRAELTLLSGHRALPGWARRIAAGNRPRCDTSRGACGRTTIRRSRRAGRGSPNRWAPTGRCGCMHWRSPGRRRCCGPSGR